MIKTRLTKREKEKIDLAMKRLREKESRRKVISEYFAEYVKHHSQWLRVVVDRYKQRGEYPIIPEYILPKMYSNKKDKEIAVFIGMLCKDRIDKVNEMRDVIGDSPWDWFINRGFVRLSHGERQDDRIGGALNWQVAAMLNELHELSFGGQADIETSLRAEAHRKEVSIEDCVVELAKQGGTSLPIHRARLALAVLSACDGIGQSIWYKYPIDLRCPVTSDVRRFMSLWWPQCKEYGTFDECVPFFGLSDDVDFYYAYLAFPEIMDSNPDKCQRYVRRYRTMYKNGTKMKPVFWRSIIPDIPF